MTIRDYIKHRFRNLALLFALPYAALQMLRVFKLRSGRVIPKSIGLRPHVHGLPRVVRGARLVRAEINHDSLPAMFPAARRSDRGHMGKPEDPSLPKLSCEP
jgi:hypothetical protein